MTNKPSPPFLGLDPLFTKRDVAAAVVIPFPFEKSTSYMTGTAQGPRRILEASEQVEFYDCETQTEAFKVGIHTTAPVDCSSKDTKEILAGAESELLPHYKEGKFPIVLGGEHTVSVAPIRAAAQTFGSENLSILHLDAHSDMRESYEGNPYSHACVMRRAHEVINRSYSVGIRAQCVEEAEYLRANRNTYGVLFDHERALDRLSLDKALKYLPTQKVYLTIDLDYFSPSEMPSVGTPVPGGGHWYETLHFLKSIFKQREVVGADVVELRPDENHRSDFLAAMLVYKLITYRFLK